MRAIAPELDFRPTGIRRRVDRHARFAGEEERVFLQMADIHLFLLCVFTDTVFTRCRVARFEGIIVHMFYLPLRFSTRGMRVLKCHRETREGLRREKEGPV